MLCGVDETPGMFCLSAHTSITFYSNTSKNFIIFKMIFHHLWKEEMNDQ